MDTGEVHGSSSLPFLSLIVAAACLAFSTLLALSLEVLVSALVSTHTESHRDSVHDAHEEKAEDYTLFREGCEIADGLVIAVVRQSCNQRMVVVSDETVDDSARVRRMYFFFAPVDSKAGDSGEFFTSTIQTEMLLDNGSVDPTVLRSKWNCLMVAALAFAGPPPILRRVCVLGHGGGALSSFLNKVLQCNVTAVDADADVLSLARSHFGDVAHVHLKDAADFLLHLDCAQTFDAVFVDLCSSSSQPLAAPPVCMYEAGVIHALFVCSPVVVVNVLGASTSTPSVCMPRPRSEWLHSSSFTQTFLRPSVKICKLCCCIRRFL